MTKKLPPLPGTTSSRTTGAGLGFLFPEDEAPTLKRIDIPMNVAIYEKCPRCDGKVLLDLQRADGRDGPNDVHEFGIFVADICPDCQDGQVTLEHADRIRAALKT